ncbi:MAG: Lin1244/Lin1753 domain-containing protein, partial [Smithella sp.]
MARPKKQTVDYFPHDCDHKKTMFILEQKYGNDGYAFWFKLLEMLGKSEGHFIDLSDQTEWEFLTSKTRVSDVVCGEILDLLSKLGAIDCELWESKIVWSQNFVDRVKDAYRNRTSEIPIRPDNLRKKSPEPDQLSPKNPQTKVKESKGKEIIKAPAEPDNLPVDNSSQEKTPFSETEQNPIPPFEAFNNPPEEKSNGNGKDEQTELNLVIEDLRKKHFSNDLEKAINLFLRKYMPDKNTNYKALIHCFKSLQ